QELVQQLSGIAGVDAAAMSYYFPAYLGNAGVLPIDRFAPVSGSDVSPVASGLTEFISPGFFELFGITRLSGRDFTWTDDTHAPSVAIVSESLVRKLFPTGDVIGRRMRVSTGPVQTDVEIVGIVADAPIGG